MGHTGSVIFSSLGFRVHSSILDHNNQRLAALDCELLLLRVYGASMIMASRCYWQVAGVQHSVGLGQALLIQCPLSQAQAAWRVWVELTGVDLS